MKAIDRQQEVAALLEMIMYRLHSCWLTVVAHEIDAAEGTAADNANNNNARANWWKTMEEVGGVVDDVRDR